MNQEPDENIPDTCSVCHQPIKREYYFCPNCGNKLSAPPLSTSIWTQIGIYAFSIILPSICFIFVTRWPGLKYSRSNDQKTRRIGYIAWSVLVLSTILTYWFAYVWTRNVIQSALDSADSALSSYSV